jgi:hypothetical protein
MGRPNARVLSRCVSSGSGSASGGPPHPPPSPSSASPPTPPPPALPAVQHVGLEKNISL